LAERKPGSHLKNQDQTLAADKRRLTQMTSPADKVVALEISAFIGGCIWVFETASNRE
jgi:hypothetical protein